MSPLRKVLMRLTRSIWQAFINNRWERANYLKTLYDKASKGSQAQGWYADIGAGSGHNSLVFGQDFAKIVLLDVKLNPESRAVVEDRPSAQWVVGNAQSLPFQACSFELVTVISTLEHLQDAESGIQEATRVINKGGELVIQVPNRHFLLDLHTGLANPFLFCPRFFRPALLSKLGYGWWVNDVHKPPSKKQLTSWVKERMRLTGVEKVIYPDVLIPKALRPLYGFFRRARLLNFVPLGYMYIYQKIG